jgi:predicted  nucleic acid-binding Zn-ribbon protein
VLDSEAEIGNLRMKMHELQVKLQEQNATVQALQCTLEKEEAAAKAKEEARESMLKDLQRKQELLNDERASLQHRLTQMER